MFSESQQKVSNLSLNMWSISKEAYQHLRKTARFRWEPVENEKFLTVTKQLGSKIRVRSENLPYILNKGPVKAITEDSQLMHPKRHIASIY